jgi:hypothetical protein
MPAAAPVRFPLAALLLIVPNHVVLRPRIARSLDPMGLTLGQQAKCAGSWQNTTTHF